MRPIFIATALALSSAAASAQPTTAPAPAVGEVAFANSGAPAAQTSFLRGLALLHNFEYAAAATAFREAQAADPGFAMAYWGEAMTHNHPIWMEQDLEAGRAALAKLAPTGEARLGRARTPRERAWLDALETLYGDGTKEQRDFAYSLKMAALHRAYPEDVDARAFYALSILGTAHGGRDYRLYMKAAGLLEEAFPHNRSHPGVLHYLIHSYDDPVHAPLGLRAARLYGTVAPGAGHALHMTSHIFIALGMWNEVERANVDAADAVNRSRAAAGKAPVRCGHYNEWLFYARLQKRDPQAERDFAACRESALKEMTSAEGPPGGEMWSAGRSFADMALRRLVDTGKWDVPPALPAGRYAGMRFSLAYGNLLAAGADPHRIREARAALVAAQKAAAAARSGTPRNHPLIAAREAVVLSQAEGLEKLAAGDVEGGLAALRAAADAEAAMPVEFGPPAIEKPSSELLAEAYARLGRKADAAMAYEKALLAAPGRRLSLAGLEAVRR